MLSCGTLGLLNKAQQNQCGGAATTQIFSAEVKQAAMQRACRHLPPNRLPRSNKPVWRSCYNPNFHETIIQRLQRPTAGKRQKQPAKEHHLHTCWTLLVNRPMHIPAHAVWQDSCRHGGAVLFQAMQATYVQLCQPDSPKQRRHTPHKHGQSYYLSLALQKAPHPCSMQCPASSWRKGTHAATVEFTFSGSVGEAVAEKV